MGFSPPTGEEDVYFCRKARAAGHRIWVNAQVNPGHVGAFSVDIDFAATWAGTQQAALAADSMANADPVDEFMYDEELGLIAQPIGERGSG